MNDELNYEEQPVINEVPDRLSHAESLAEALLFAAGSPVLTEDIAYILKVSSREAESVLSRLSAYYESHNSGLVLKKVNQSYQLASKSVLHDELKPYFEQVSALPLSRSALEALTIIAYNQPITRGGVEIIRGVNSDSVVSTLLERGLICEKGKSDSPGRPVLYGTTDLFLKSAGIADIDELRTVIPLPDLSASSPSESSEVPGSSEAPEVPESSEEPEKPDETTND
ncbi:MAG: SMC-Scp complex subunit ScpB [Clostridia bacterium]|nr:SMC-Scp complex subunit ScpB [Clostridia bacterium]